MKNYEEVAKSVFKRSEEMIAQNKRHRRDRLINIGATVSCLAVAGAVGIGVWKTAARPDAQFVSDIYPQQSSAVQSAGQFADDGKDHSGETDVIANDIGTESSGTDTVGVDAIGAGPENTPYTPTETSATSQPDIESSDSGDVIFPAYEPPAENTEAPVNGAAGGALDNGGGGTVNYLTVVEEYDSYVNGCYLTAPENGTFRYSDDLKGAMEEYGYTDKNGDILYRVAVDFYSNGESIDVNLPAIREIECQRLMGCGYQCHFETCTKDWGNIVDHHFCMMLTREQLENFPPCDNYGCEFHLYGEKHCILLDDDTSTSSDYTPPAQNQGCHHGMGVDSGNGYGNGYGNGNGNGYGCGHHGAHC